MALAITDDHRALASVVRSFLEAHKSREHARALLDAVEETTPPFWTELSALGWLGLHIPEAYGGEGYGLEELAVVLEELGRAITPGPFLSTVLASGTIAGAADEALCRAVLPSLADGTRIGAVALSGSITRQPDGTFTGSAQAVLSGALADVLLLPVGADLIVVDRTDPGVVVEPCDTVDLTRRAADVRCDGCSVPDDRIIRGGRAVSIRLARTMTAAEAAGGAGACLEMAVQYAQQRVQFGRPIGAFQAVKHHCANLRVGVESGIAAAWDAARAQRGTSAPEADLAAAVAALQALPMFVRAAEQNIQLHGGIGYTWEHDAHVYLRRAVTLSAIVGAAGDVAQDTLRLIRSGAQRRFAIDLPAEADEYRRQARSFADEISADPPADQLSALASSGYLVPHWPKPWGRGAGPVEQLVIDEELADIERPDLNISGWVTLTLVQHGTPEQHDRWIEGSLRGQLEWCQLFSEPEAGSDAAAISTRGERVEGGWRVQGQKVWTSNAQRCDWGLATIRTDPSTTKHAGITMMAIDLRAPGVEIRPLRELTGEALFNEVFFNDVFVPDTDVVGEVGQGWTVARATMGNERVSMGGGSGSGAPAHDLLPLLERHAASDPCGARDVAHVLAEGLTIGLINLRQVARTVAGDDLGAEASITKLLAAEHSQHVSGLALRLGGVDAVTGRAPEVVHNYLFTRCLTIGGGTSEVMRNQIAERVLRLPRDPVRT